MAPMSVARAIFARLSEDDTLRGHIVALTPKGQPTGETDLLRRFSLAPGPQDKPTYPLVLWRLVGTPTSERTRCGGIDATFSRFRVWIENPGRGMAALEDAAERIGVLLGGYEPDSNTFFALDTHWIDNPTGASGDYVEAGWEIIVRVNG